MKIAVLLPKERESLDALAYYRKAFRDTGDWSVYTLMPSIVLGPGIDINQRIDIGSGIFTLSGKAVFNGSFMVDAIESPYLEAIATMKPGFFLSRRPEYPYKEKLPFTKLQIRSIATVEITDTSYKILQERLLSPDNGRTKPLQ